MNIWRDWVATSFSFTTHRKVEDVKKVTFKWDNDRKGGLTGYRSVTSNPSSRSDPDGEVGDAVHNARLPGLGAVGVKCGQANAGVLVLRSRNIVSEVWYLYMGRVALSNQVSIALMSGASSVRSSIRRTDGRSACGGWFFLLQWELLGSEWTWRSVRMAAQLGEMHVRGKELWEKKKRLFLP